MKQNPMVTITMKKGGVIKAELYPEIPPNTVSKFISLKNSGLYNGQYAAFGKVVEGMEIVDRIVSAKRDRSDRPYDDEAMDTVTVDLFGETYPEVNKM